MTSFPEWIPRWIPNDSMYVIFGGIRNTKCKCGEEQEMSLAMFTAFSFTMWLTNMIKIFG